MLVWIQPHNGQDISQSGNKEGFCYGCCRGQWQLHPGPAIITIKYWPATMAAHWNIKQLECWIWNFSSCYWTFSIALKHQLSARSFSASSHRRSHLSDKKHLWDWSTSQMPDRNQYKINPTEMAIFLIQTIAELYFARQFLQELPSWSLKAQSDMGEGKGQNLSSSAFPPKPASYPSLFKTSFIFAPGKKWNDCILPLTASVSTGLAWWKITWLSAAGRQ